MVEVWRDINGWLFYQISSFGRVRSLARTEVRFKSKRGDWFVRKSKGRILKQNLGSSGYLQVMLSYNGQQENIMVHKLVTQHFLPNPNNLP
jgi:hypothetical protein